MDTRKFISCHLGQQRRQWRWASSGGGGEIRDLYNINSKWSVVRRRRPEWSFGETCNRLNQQSEWIGEGARALFCQTESRMRTNNNIWKEKKFHLFDVRLCMFIIRFHSIFHATMAQ